MSTRTTVEELLNKMSSGDADITAELFAEKVDFMCAGSEKVPWIRPRRTRQDVVNFFASMNASFVPRIDRPRCPHSSSTGRTRW